MKYDFNIFFLEKKCAKWGAGPQQVPVQILIWEIEEHVPVCSLTTYNKPRTTILKHSFFPQDWWSPLYAAVYGPWVTHFVYSWLWEGNKKNLCIRTSWLKVEDISSSHSVTQKQTHLFTCVFSTALGTALELYWTLFLSPQTGSLPCSLLTECLWGEACGAGEREMSQTHTCQMMSSAVSTDDRTAHSTCLKTYKLAQMQYWTGALLTGLS